MPRTIALLVLLFVPSVLGFGGEAVELNPDMSSIQADDGAGSMEGRHDLYYLYESFDGPDFPPAGWSRYTSHPNQSYFWEQNNSDHAGGTAPEACVEYAYWASMQDYQIILYTPALDTSDAFELVLQFKHHLLLGYYPAGHAVYVSVTSDGTNWVDMTPWSNPAWWYYYEIGPETVTINLNPFIGPATRVAFWIFVPYSANNLEFWALDDVKIYKKHLHFKIAPEARAD
jgi:hypothetical protein